MLLYFLFHGLLNFLRDITKYLTILLFHFAKQDFTFAFAYYFEIRCQMNNKQTELDLYKIFTNYIKILDPDIKKEIAKTNNFIQLVHIATSESYTTKQWEHSFNNFFKINEWVRLPWNYKYICTGILYRWHNSFQLLHKTLENTYGSRRRRFYS